MYGPEQLQLRVYGPANRPALIYCPGLHGDWTLVRGFRAALADQVRFVEITYPRSLDWSLEEYAQAIERALAAHQVTRGWLLGESFGSQVVWALARRGKFNAEGLILAGGFVRYPWPLALRLGRRVAGRASFAVLKRLLFLYSALGRLRYRRSPEVRHDLNEFIARRTEADWHAARHRLELIAQNDPRETARMLSIPVFGLSGLVDPLVSWPHVRRWLKHNCGALRDFKVIFRADHTVLATAPKAAARQILEWLSLPHRPIERG